MSQKNFLWSGAFEKPNLNTIQPIGDCDESSY